MIASSKTFNNTTFSTEHELSNQAISDTPVLKDEWRQELQSYTNVLN